MKLASLAGSEPALASRIVVKSISAVGYDLCSELYGQPRIAAPAMVRALLAKAASEVEGSRFSLQFLVGEWGTV
ncbi:hypothetical protein J4E08_23015 [Sagittula sp. NFXS13]|uniref:hypothetical protein n=1 Tax=Sagittula sp. NFXS13 TaxID=2819095 RepID=UPI0032DE9C4E